MRRSIYLLIFFMFLFRQSTAQCVQKAPLNIEACYDPAQFTIGSKSYFACGYRNGFYSSSFMNYDSNADQWTKMSDFPGRKRQDAVGFTIGNYGYVMLGVGDDLLHLNDLWKYDPLNNTWEQQAAFPGKGRSFPFCVVVEGYAYLGTGYNPSFEEVGTDFWRYDPINDSWLQLQNFPGPNRIFTLAMAIGGKLIAGLGETTDYPRKYLLDFYAYDPQSNQWTTLNDAPLPGNPPGYSSGPFSSFVLSNSGFVHRNLNGFWKYEIQMDSWTKQPDCLTDPTDNLTGFQIGPYGYLGLGVTGDWELPKKLYRYGTQTTSVKGEMSDRQITIFPNPAITEINFDGDLEGDYQMTDCTGKVICRGTVVKNKIKVDGLCPGLYLLRVENQEGIFSIRFVKQ